VRKSTSAAGSFLFFLAAPSVVAGLLPWYLTGWATNTPADSWWPPRVAGVVLVVFGVSVLVHAFVRFVTEGVGTPAPVAPTEELVVGGLYRYIRNPMYLAVTVTILGQALLLGRPVLVVYGLGVWTVMAAFARWYEEPALERRFGAHYIAYRRAVPAWIPRRTSRRR
jgi:protein-S-isoprenylcysteine O-methyltransferase Ste14